jgi:hypothetical protein
MEKDELFAPIMGYEELRWGSLLPFPCLLSRFSPASKHKNFARINARCDLEVISANERRRDRLFFVFLLSNSHFVFADRNAQLKYFFVFLLFSRMGLGI